MPRTKQTTFLTAAEVADKFGCDTSTVRRMVQDGRLTATKLPGKTGALLFDADDIADVIAESATVVRVGKASA